MKRPEQHETDDLGRVQMLSVFAPLGWTANRIEHDYGVDYDVEVFEGGKTTGVTFKVQLKSSQSTLYSADESFISQELTVPQARYLTGELRTPTFLLHADVATGRTYWTAPQLDGDFTSKLAAADEESSITVRIRTANSLPATATELLAALGRAGTLVALRVLGGTTAPALVEVLKGQPSRADVIREFQAKAEALRVDEAYRRLNEGSLEEARQHVKAVLGDVNASVEGKFSAMLVAEMVEARSLQAGDGGDQELHRMMLEIAVRLQELTKKGPAHLKFYALIQRTAAQLDYLIHRDWGLFMNARSQQGGGDPLWIAQLGLERARLAQQINRKYRQCARLLACARQSRHRWALTPPVLRVANALLPLIIRLRYEGEEEAAKQVRGLAFGICKLGASFASEVDDQKGLVLAASTASLLATEDDSPEDRWAREMASALTGDEERRGAQELIERAARRKRGERDPRAKRATARQIYENMAAAVGIDLADRRDPISGIVRIGIADLDPTRVLRHCQHMFLWRGSGGLVAEWLRLPSAGSKVLHCTLHHYTYEGLVLDRLHAGFKKAHCDTCPDRSPREADWSCTEEWYRVELERHSDVVRRWEAAAYGAEESP